MNHQGEHEFEQMRQAQQSFCEYLAQRREQAAQAEQQKANSDQKRLQAYLSGHPDNPPIVLHGIELRAARREQAAQEKDEAAQ